MSGDHFIFIIFQRADNQRGQNALGENAPNQLIHFIIVFHLKGVIFKGAQLLNRQLHGLYIFFTQGQYFPFFQILYCNIVRSPYLLL